MDSRYIITSNGGFINYDELYHWGIKGMKWGVRRYQNPDGSLTSAGRKRYTNSDGTLNKKGQKYYAKEAERLKAERKKLNAQKRTSAKLAKLDEIRKGNDDILDQLKNNKSDSAFKKEKVSDMSDDDLQKRVNRLRNENTYKILSKDLGYDGPKTELDALIENMEKQKKYLQLQKDIKDLTPKKVSRGKKIVDSVFKKVVEPAATEAGKKFLSQYLSDAATKALKDEADKTVKNIDKSIQKNKQKVERQEAKKEARKEKTESSNNNQKQSTKETMNTGEKEIKRIINDSSKKNNTASSMFDSDYEQRVDRMLADMYEKGWKMYEEYRKRGGW